jgi:hypothetical protein
VVWFVIVFFGFAIIPGTMQAFVFTAITAFLVVQFGENKISILVYVVVNAFL